MADTVDEKYLDSASSKEVLPLPSSTSQRDGDLGWWKRFVGSGGDQYQTSRSMQSRHLMMIAIGGTIGMSYSCPLSRTFPLMSICDH